MSKPKKFKVYVVADAYKWWDLSVYPDVYEKWIKQMVANPNEVTFFFQTIMMTQEQYEQSCRDLKRWNDQEAQGLKPPSKEEPAKIKPKLEVVQEPATVLHFPRKDQ